MRPTYRLLSVVTVSRRAIPVALLGALFTTSGLAQDDELSWPREYDAEGRAIVIYQPQIESFEQDRLEARTAVSITEPGGGAPVFGAVWIASRVATDLGAREVSLLDLDVVSAKFPDEAEEAAQALTTFLEVEVPTWEVVIDLDRLLAALDGVHGGGSDVGLRNDPPRILVAREPTALVSIDGDPVLRDVEGSKLQYVANSAFFIVLDPKKKRYYLRGGDLWYVSTEILSGWETTSDVPKEVRQLAEKMVPPDEEPETAEATSADAAADGEDPADLEPVIPAIVVATEPTELIQSDGEPEWKPVPDTTLLYLGNSEADVVLDIASQQYYVLLAGRWYRSSSVAEGEWTYVALDALPDAFALIPVESDMGSVRVAVAGTDEAREAVLENSIPQTAEVDRKTASVTVTYDGSPEFEAIEGTSVAYGRNTDKAVFLIDGGYWCCDEAVWFESRGPEGPWTVATSVPEEIRDLPPDCPHYNVKYVYIYDSTPEVVYVGYTPAYTGSYVHGGVVVYGTGFWYRPWVGVVYYPRPVTWGFGVHWNPWTGWGFSFGMRVGWVGWGWHPWYRRAWWGPAGYRAGYRHGFHHGYHHGYRRGASAGFRAGYRAGQHHRQPNVYAGRHDGVRSTGAKRNPNARQGRPSTRPNNVYADRGGNVHRKSGNDWQTRQGGQWSGGSGGSGSGQKNLNRDYQSRQRGNQRANQRSRSGGSRSGGGRSGGGRRR